MPNQRSGSIIAGMGERKLDEWEKRPVRTVVNVRRMSHVQYSQIPKELPKNSFKPYRRGSLPQFCEEKGHVSLPLFPRLQKKSLKVLLHTSLQVNEESKRKSRVRNVSTSSFWTRSLEGFRKGLISFDKVRRRSSCVTLALLDKQLTPELHPV